jgi:transcriptional regulator with XRE-family HTH domain
MSLLEEIAGGPLTLGNFLKAIREGEGLSQADFAARLEISKSHLSEVETGRKAVSPARAAKWAEALGYSSQQFVQLALQEELAQAGLRFKVCLTAA